MASDKIKLTQEEFESMYTIEDEEITGENSTTKAPAKPTQENTTPTESILDDNEQEIDDTDMKQWEEEASLEKLLDD